MVMSEDTYGQNTKRIVFTENDHRHAQLIVKLKMDGMTQAKFFRQMITGYLEDDERIRSYVLDNSSLSKVKVSKSMKLFKRGKEVAADLGLNDDQVENIFDMIAEEFPDL
jgi:hydroxylamine reductase (hybrid-cluster protein)